MQYLQHSPIATAPHNWTEITVLAGHDQQPVLAMWSDRLDGWVDQQYRQLKFVEWWVPDEVTTQ